VGRTIDVDTVPIMNERRFCNALTSTGERIDPAVRDGRFVQPDSLADEAERIDLDGLLVVPGFVDGHIHLDKSFVGDRWHPHRAAGSLRERLAIEKRLLADAGPVAARCEALLAQAHAFGTVAMRSHVDIDANIGLAHLHAVMAVCERWQDRIAVQLVAFPQQGILSSPGTAELLDEAIGQGASVVGGLDPSTFDGDAEAHLDVVFGIAERRDADVDIHLHEHGAGGIRQLERIAMRTAAAGLGGRVTVSHAYALGDVPIDEARRAAAVLARAGVSIMTNAPGEHPFPPIATLRDEGVHVFAGNDNIRDAWWPFGDADPLERAMLIAYRSGWRTDAELATALELVTGAPARTLGLPAQGFDIGDEATFVVLSAPNVAAAVAAPRDDRVLVQRGDIVPREQVSMVQRLAQRHGTDAPS